MKRILIAGLATLLLVLGLGKFYLAGRLNSVLELGISVPLGGTEIPALSDTRNTICFQEQAFPGGRAKVSVHARNIEKKLLGIGFDLEFDPKVFEFLNYEKGSFFERGGEPMYAVKLSWRKSGIITGISLKRGDELQSGSGLIISFYFKAKERSAGMGASASGKFLFRNTVAATLKRGERKDIFNIVWERCDYLHKSSTSRSSASTNSRLSPARVFMPPLFSFVSISISSS